MEWFSRTGGRTPARGAGREPLRCRTTPGTGPFRGHSQRLFRSTFCLRVSSSVVGCFPVRSAVRSAATLQLPTMGWLTLRALALLLLGTSALLRCAGRGCSRVHRTPAMVLPVRAAAVAALAARRGPSPRQPSRLRLILAAERVASAAGCSPPLAMLRWRAGGAERRQGPCSATDGGRELRRHPMPQVRGWKGPGVSRLPAEAGLEERCGARGAACRRPCCCRSGRVAGAPPPAHPGLPARRPGRLCAPARLPLPACRPPAVARLLLLLLQNRSPSRRCAWWATAPIRTQGCWRRGTTASGAPSPQTPSARPQPRWPAASWACPAARQPSSWLTPQPARQTPARPSGPRMCWPAMAARGSWRTASIRTGSCLPPTTPTTWACSAATGRVGPWVAQWLARPACR